MDLIVLILPLLYIRNLQVERSKKLIVVGMFMFGGFVVAISIILLVACAKLDTASPDISWTISPIVVWAYTESNLSVVTSCLPSLRPIFLLLTKGSASPRPKKPSQQFTDTSNGNNKALTTFGSKGRVVRFFYWSYRGDEHHTFSIMGDERGNKDPAGQDSNIDLEELRPPQDRVMVREHISVKYSNA